jgi:Protein of unknown function (DUF1572)
MNTVITDLADLYQRDLTRLLQQIQAFPTDESLWQVVPGITNSAGTLVLHLEGGLKHFVGYRLGELDYKRNRPAEFSGRGLTKAELLSRLEELRRLVPAVIRSLSEETMQQQYPEVVLERPLSTEAWLISLFGHVSWHLGQIDYLRRMLTGNSAIELAGL